MRQAYEVPLRRGGILTLSQHTLVMGVLNVTPDSFSDGGHYFNTESARDHGLRLIEEGADILDIGGESTRPGARSVSSEEEAARVLPVIEAIRRHSGILISIDTYKAEVARQAIAAGADLVNDVSGFRFDPQLPQVVRTTDVPIILMHLRGTPQTMKELPPSPDIMKDIETGLGSSMRIAEKHGIAPEKIILDPGIGFGKNADENLIVLNRLAELAALGRPLLIGTSRKSFLGHLLNKPTDQRLMGSVASAAVAVLRGAHIVRVHDVQPIKEAMQVLDAILAETTKP